MIHDQSRVDSIRSRAKAQLELITSLEARIVKGKLDELQVARNQTGDIESLFLHTLHHEDRSSASEAQWLNGAELILTSWGPRLKALQEKFDKYGGSGVEIIGG